MGRYSRLRHIQTLDPEHDYEEIFQLVTRYEFPWDYNQGYSFAFVTDFAIPSITETLAATGEFAHHGMKRFDDTMLFPYEAHRAGLESRYGRDVVRALNKIHSHYEISNEDYLHILASHLVSAVTWINAYGWRPLSHPETRALTLAYRRLGELMGIKDIPADYQEFAAWLAEDLRTRGKWHYANREMAMNAIRIIAALCPRGLRFLATRAVIALVDEPVRTVLDLPAMPAWFTTAVRRCLRARGRLVRLMPPRPVSRAYVRTPRSYPLGWTLDQLGPTGHSRP
ncbi:oxygenase MpaB family protein [Streptomyces luteireticuli]|uniref:Oxygenase MpaB family protein n=1 Tax=Streptomyces luteireticuli TaxID=173858 RepID=A0ABN0YZT4_9ACTN